MSHDFCAVRQTIAHHGKNVNHPSCHRADIPAILTKEGSLTAKPYWKKKAQGGKVVESLGIYRVFDPRKTIFFNGLHAIRCPDTG
jgi:hypothetical protein